MKVIRKQEIETKEILIGDQIMIELTGFGNFTATAQEIRNDGIIFMFDSCVAKKQMNKSWTNEGGYEKSELAAWMGSTLFDSFPNELKNRIKNLTIPTYGQMFGHDNFYEDYLISDNDKQFTLMAVNKNRIANYNDDYSWYWLRNATKKDVSAASFALVTDSGYAGSYGASNSCGVRPVFLLDIK